MGSSGGSGNVMNNGVLSVTAPELAEFAALASVQPIAQHTWWINLETGETHVTRTVLDETPPDGCARLMTGPAAEWVGQWDGDWQRACDEQLNPILAEIKPSTPEEES